MVGIAQLVRASGCGPEGRRFESGYSPQNVPLCGNEEWKMKNEEFIIYVVLFYDQHVLYFSLRL